MKQRAMSDDPCADPEHPCVVGLECVCYPSRPLAASYYHDPVMAILDPCTATPYLQSSPTCQLAAGHQPEDHQATVDGQPISWPSTPPAARPPQ